MACIFSVALIASLPTYGAAVKLQMLQRELAERGAWQGRPPLVFIYTATATNVTNAGTAADLDNYVSHALATRFGLPIHTKRVNMTTNAMSYALFLPDGTWSRLYPHRITVRYVEGLYDHIELVGGRLPADGLVDGVLEVIVSESAAHAGQFMLGSAYDIVSPHGIEHYTRFRVVGVYRPADINHPFWQSGVSNRGLYAGREAFMELYHISNAVYSMRWEFSLDHTELTPGMIPHILESLENRDHGWMGNLDVLRDAMERESALNSFLWIMQIPTLALLVFFTVMLSGLLLDHDRTEIALLYSRGAGKGRIFAMYSIQTVLLAGIALALGLPLSFWLCSAMGIASGFLEFAARAALPVVITRESIGYAMLGAGVFAVSMLAPILFTRAGSIVQIRRAKAARGQKPFFEKFYLDVILLGVAAYQYFFAYRNVSAMLEETGVAADQYAIDPMIFMISTFFIAGGAMLFTRLYPYLIRVLFWLGRTLWSPAIYASLSAARTRPRSRYIMLFIIMTVSIGLYNSAAARTINQNLEDRALYGIGADIVISEQWPFFDIEPRFDDQGFYIQRDDHDPLLVWTETSFERFTNLEGIGLATRVYRNQHAQIHIGRGRSVQNVQVTAIYPHEFAQLSWWRGDMYDYHFNYMMNAMAANPYVVLLSRNLMERLGVAHGDSVFITWAPNQREIEFFVYDAVDFFPKYYAESPAGTPQYLIVMNYSLVWSQFRVDPYEVWIQVADGYTASQVQRNMTDAAIRARHIEFSANAIAGVRGDSMVLSMNGFLSLSFVMTIAVTAAGFLIFWVFDLRSRRLQIGIIRSMGMPRRSVIAMLLFEQVLLSGLPLAIGFAFGWYSSALFVPMFEMGSAGPQLPFVVFSLLSDYMRVGGIVAGIIAFAILLLGAMAARIRISQTLKLGEE
jgi:putative ABC transport system permease protein